MSAPNTQIPPLFLLVLLYVTWSISFPYKHCPCHIIMCCPGPVPLSSLQTLSQSYYCAYVTDAQPLDSGGILCQAECDMDQACTGKLIPFRIQYVQGKIIRATMYRDTPTKKAEDLKLNL